MGFKWSALGLIFFLFLSGCAHRELMNDGDDYISQGHYQLALERYLEALEVKPNDIKTQQKVAQAQRNFNLWLDRISVAAIQAEKDNLPAKAQILYAKLLKHRNNLQYRQKLVALSRKNLDNFGLKVQLIMDEPQLNQSFGELEHFIRFEKTIDHSQSNEMSLAVSLSEIRYTTNDRAEARVAEYISGYEAIINPEYQAVQDEIFALRALIKESSNVLLVNEKQQKVEHTQLQLLSKDIQIKELLLEKAEKNSEEFYQLTRELSELNEQFDSQERRYSKNQKKLRKQIKIISEYEQDLDEYFYELEYLPKLVDVPVYSEYAYQVNISQQTAKAQMQVKRRGFEKAESIRSYQLQAIHQDESHPAFQTIGLQQNPLQLKNKSQLRQIVYTNGRHKLADLVAKELDEHQQRLIIKGNNSAQLTERLEYWLLSGIVSRSGFTRQMRYSINDLLKTEFGHGGYFELEQLIQQN